MPDAVAKGVLCDHVLLLPHASQPNGNLRLSEIFSHAHGQNNQDLWRSLHLSFLEVPLLEERKRAPTRHPRDLEVHVGSIVSALAAAQSQVTTQAKILFSSPKFSSQDLVILVASSGEYYRLAVLSRSHAALSTLPSREEVLELFVDPVGDYDPAEVVDILGGELVLSARSPTQQERQRLEAKQEAEKAEREKQNKARDARALARSQRQQALSNMQGLERKLSQLVNEAGDPNPSYSDEWVEAYYKIERQFEAGTNDEVFQRYLTFFEPEPKSHETVTTLANITNPRQPRKVVFTGVIRIGSRASDKFMLMIRQHLSTLARIERSRRQ